MGKNRKMEVRGIHFDKVDDSVYMSLKRFRELDTVRISKETAEKIINYLKEMFDL